jgi:hypothetical protein
LFRFISIWTKIFRFTQISQLPKTQNNEISSGLCNSLVAVAVVAVAVVVAAKDVGPFQDLPVATYWRQSSIS